MFVFCCCFSFILICCVSTNINDLDLEYVYYDAHDAPFRFDSMNDMNAQHYLYQNGYIVIKNIFQNEQELEYAKSLLWKSYLNRIGWKQNDPSTWNEFPGYWSNGIVYQHGIGQSEFQWFIRTRPKLLDTFHSIWNLTDSNTHDHNDLITSFDGIGIFRPWKYNAKWETFGDWFHIDQNIVRKPGLDCIQGLVSLTEQNNITGSTVVIPKSHLYTSTYLADRMSQNDYNFQLIDDDKLYALFEEPYNLQPLFVSMKKGDLLLWNAKLIHCNSPSLEILYDDDGECVEDDDNVNDSDIELLRVVSYVCFTPKQKATKEAILTRIHGFEEGKTSNHNPHEPALYLAATTKPKYHRNKQLDVELIKKLVGY